MNWDSFVYEYSVGGAVFLAGFILAWRSGDYSLKNSDDRRTAVYLAAIFLFYFCGHLAWQVLAAGGA